MRLPMLRLLRALVAGAALAAPSLADAACTGPAGNAGDQSYFSNYSIMAFCDGTNWVSMAGATSVSATDSRIGTIAANKWCVANAGGTGFDCTSNDPTGSIAGSDQQVIFNSGGTAYAGSAGLLYDSAAGKLTATNISATTLHVAGNVGIGTTTPTRQLTVGSGTGNPYASVNGGDSGTNGGAAWLIERNGALKSAFGTASAIFGGAFVSNTLIYTADILRFYSAGAERMRLDATGNIGIGVTNPLHSFQVAGVTPKIVVQDTSVDNAANALHGEFGFGYFADASLLLGGMRLLRATGGTNGYNGYATVLTGITDGGSLTNVLYAGGNGNVGIGDTAPDQRLRVVGNATADALYARAGAAGVAAIVGFSQNSSAYGMLGFNNAWGVLCNATNCGGNQAWTNYSDARLKNRIHDLSEADGLSTVMKLRPIRFHWRDIDQDKAKGEQLGLLAQEVAKVLPEVIGDPVDSRIRHADGSTEIIKGTLNLSYATLVVPLIKSVQELKTANDNLVSETSYLRGQLKAANANIGELRDELRDLKNGVGFRRTVGGN